MEQLGTTLGATSLDGHGSPPEGMGLDHPVQPEELTGIEMLAGLPWPALRELAGHARR